MQKIPYLRQCAIVIYAGLLTATGLKAQTIDIVCEGQIKHEFVLIGKLNQIEPTVYPKTVNYHFLDGKQMVPDLYPAVKIPYSKNCTWAKGQVTCKDPDLQGYCLEAEFKGEIEKELSYCRNILKINRFNGALSEENWSYQKNHPLLGEIIFGQTFKATCNVVTQQKF